MAKKPIKPENDPSTEEKIKKAARLVFHQKGFAATRTRDIAEASGINLALLNYYFRSKEKLFDIIMLETMQRFMQTIAQVIHDPSTSLEEKMEALVARYLDVFQAEPEIPLFIMSELRSNPKNLLDHIRPKEFLMQSSFVRQFEQAIKDKLIPPQPFIHFLMNLMGLIIFPFIASPMFRNLAALDEQQYADMIQSRKKMIPRWVSAMMQVNPSFPS